MSWRIAAASADNFFINEHFGRARWFFILDINPDGSYTTVERRMVNPICSHGEHSEPGIAGSIEAISDCIAVLVAVIGPGARNRLEAAGIAVFEHPDTIENAVKKLAAYYVRTKRPE
jgi:predicted Fe-Mo cluster-binding NifX family protein